MTQPKDDYRKQDGHTRRLPDCRQCGQKVGPPGSRCGTCGLTVAAPPASPAPGPAAKAGKGQKARKSA